MQTSRAKQILIVDDEIHIVNVITMKFRQAGYGILTAGNLEQAYEIARQEQPDLIITDHQMPNGSGMELCEKLKAVPGTSEIPVILLTAYATLIEQDQLDGCQVCAIVPKPFSPRDLVERAKGILEHKPVVS